MPFTPVTVPGSFVRAEVWERTLWVRPLQGTDELLLAEELRGAFPAVRVTALLERAIALEGGAVAASREFIRDLSAGNREALVLQLRRLTFGDRVSCLLVCPSCGEKLDLDLSISALLLDPTSDSGRSEYAVTVNGHTNTFR